VVCAGNEGAEVEQEALKSSESREIKDHESNDDVLRILSKGCGQKRLVCAKCGMGKRQMC
jgi:hypothetical protein